MGSTRIPVSEYLTAATRLGQLVANHSTGIKFISLA